MKQTVKINDWKLSWIENAKVKREQICLKTPADVANGGFRAIRASVPGNFELDFMREGILEDVYWGQNTVKTQRLENLHLYYYTDFTYEQRDGMDAELCFGGIDTAAEIYLDGELLGFVENMFHAHTFDLNALENGKHSLLVHILPSAIYAREFEVPAMCFGLKYNQDGIQLRKAGSMFGWDIMPRLVSGGLWKPVEIVYKPQNRIVDPFTYTMWANEHDAFICTTLRIQSDEDFISDFRLILHGECGDSVIHHEYRPFCASCKIQFGFLAPKLWWPKNYGEQNMYDMEIKLVKDGVEYDSVKYRFGIRTLQLKRTSRSGDDGDFCFIVNGKRIFAMGTNWVPCDAFPSRHDDYTLRNIKLADKQGCNMIRCWGGNVYPSDVLYDYCDEHGIMIRQDFSFACGHYPDDERLCKLVKEEIKHIAIEKRNHPSLVLWAGDNECDIFVVPYWEQHRNEDDPTAMLDPNYNVITRDIILHELRNHDATRPYLPSSPYLDPTAYKYGMPSEDHLWGPRDYFKGDFYGNSECHFASEIGYHGCPSPESIKKFIPAESLPKESIYEICDNPDWLIHAAGMEPYVDGNPYSYRNRLMVSQVERLFGTPSGDLAEFARQSQVSQAEAVKYFIERFRIHKWRMSGILWWNIADGWPQVSDAVVDWYGCKKIAYYYIKRSQTPFCMMFDEPVDGKLTLVAANDTQSTVHASYTVTDLTTGATVTKGNLEIEANGCIRVEQVPEAKNGFYMITWESDAGSGRNHFTCTIGDGWTWDAYRICMQKAGFYDEYEGF